jgi:hypothetical protein
MTMTLIETKTLGASATSIQFTAIPQAFTDLVVLCSLRSDRAAAADGLNLQFNGTSVGFSSRDLFGFGTYADSFGNTDSYAGPVPSPLFTSNTFGNTMIYVPNYTGAINKSWSVDTVTENNGSLSYQVIFAGIWTNTAAITSVTLFPFSPNNWVAGSTVSLYGITKGSSGGVVVS